MFHKFPAAHFIAQSKHSITKREVKSTAAGNPSRPDKRSKTAFACHRCRERRVKCTERKPCAPCVASKVQCVSKHASTDPDAITAAPTHTIASAATRADHTTTHGSHAEGSATHEPPLRHWCEEPDLTRASPCHGEHTNIIGHRSEVDDHALFPSMPHQPLPSTGQRKLWVPLSDAQRSYYLRLYWNVCHPLVPILGEAEFAEIVTMRSFTTSEEYSTKDALVDSMIALGVQHCHAAGLSGRIVGPQQQSASESSSHMTVPSVEEWAGWQFFERARESMRTLTEMRFDDLLCQIHLVLYLLRGSAFYDAYNLLGITVRKAYMTKYHRILPANLSEAEKRARIQMWLALFSLDVQCSLQLDMPNAIQKDLLNPTLLSDARLFCHRLSNEKEKGCPASLFSGHIGSLAIILTEIRTLVPLAELEDLVVDAGDPSIIEQHAANLDFAMQELGKWRTSLPSSLQPLLESEDVDGDGTAAFRRTFNQPHPLQWQAVLTAVHFHHVHVLLQRPLIRLIHLAPTVFTQRGELSHVQQHIEGAFSHAKSIIRIVSNVCSSSDMVYGWPEVLQPLWNATLTVFAYAYIESDSAIFAQTGECLTQALAIAEFFSFTCPSAESMKATLRTLMNRMQQSVMQYAHDPEAEADMTWESFNLLLEPTQMAVALSGAIAASGDPTNDWFVPNLSPFSSYMDTTDYSALSAERTQR